MDDWKWYDYYAFYVRMVVVVVVEEDAWLWLEWNGDPSSSSFVLTDRRKGNTGGGVLFVGRSVYMLNIQIVSQ